MLQGKEVAVPIEDHRNRVVRAPECPNRIDKEDPDDKVSGTCKGCAWGFITPEGKGVGEDIAGLTLTPLMDGDKQAGYQSHCGVVSLYTDQNGRIGAMRGNRFFELIADNPAAVRFKREKPHLFEKVAA